MIAGRGVVAIRKFTKKEFLLQYPGKLISGKEGDRREDEAHQDTVIFSSLMDPGNGKIIIKSVAQHSLI